MPNVLPLLKSWQLSKEIKQLDNNRVSHIIICTDPKTGLVVRCEAVEYLDFPTVEWVLRLINTGSADTPILENIKALDVNFSRKAETGEYLLRHWNGTFVKAEDYALKSTTLTAGREFYFSGDNLCRM